MRELARYISVGIVLSAFLAAAIVGCTSSAPEPTPDVQAVIEAAVAKALPTATPTPPPDIDATVSAAMADRGGPYRHARTNSHSHAFSYT